MATCRLFCVAGQVQGVWYRASTQQKAITLDLTGYAKNLPDGRVEVLACGDEENIQSLENWLWQGPDMAQVNSVTETETQTPDRMPSRFETL